MGFVVGGKTYRLVWDGTTDFEGMEVRVRSLPLGGFLQVTGLASLAGVTAASIASIPPEDIANLREFFETLAGSLVSWNLEREDGTAVPATVEGLMSLDLPLVMAIVGQWTTAVGGVAPPLPGGSGGGGTPKLPEVSLPMELLPASP